MYQVNPFTYGMVDLGILNDDTQPLFGTSLLFGASIVLIIMSIYMNKRRGIR